MYHTSVAQIDVPEKQHNSHLLPIKHVVIFPELANTKTFMQATILVRLCEKPGRVHEIFAYKCVELKCYEILQASYLENI